MRRALLLSTDVNTRIQSYISLADLVKTRSADSCIFYLNEAQKLFWLINSMPYLGKVYEIKGDIERSRNDFAEATRLYIV